MCCYLTCIFPLFWQKIGDQKLTAFSTGSMGTRGLSKKEIEELKKKEEEEAAAHVSTDCKVFGEYNRFYLIFKVFKLVMLPLIYRIK